MMWNQQKRPEPEKPLMLVETEKHTVTYPKCDVCENSVSMAVVFKHLQDRKHDINRTQFHSTYFQPTTICKPCLAKALELPVDPTKCNYCGK